MSITSTDLFIIAAGKGSRMGGSIPKALVPLTNEPNLTTMLQQIGHKFRKVFVATNVEVQGQWGEYFTHLMNFYPEIYSRIENVPIQSGRGDGHAVREALRKTYPNASSDIVIAWGDVFIPQSEIIDEVLEVEFDHNTWGVVPVVKEVRPYVTIKVDQNNFITHADFAKLGETNEFGYHDQSIFRFNRPLLMNALHMMDSVLNKNGVYITPNHEMSLLHVFHYAHAAGNISSGLKAIETKYPTMSFNTVEEVADIQREIEKKWQHKFRS